MNCYFKKYKLHFKRSGGTSRGVLHDKDTYFIVLRNSDDIAIGECNLFTGLSYDNRAGYEEKLQEVCNRLPDERENVLNDLVEWPSIYFGVETVLKDWENGCKQIIFPEVIAEKGFSIPVNGLIWMDRKEEMLQQIIEKLKGGFASIKLKIGAIDFETELSLIQFVRKQFTAQETEIRLDANGSFTLDEAKEKLKVLSEYQISYIEQPIKSGQWQEMAVLTENSPIDIALDEELIGINSQPEREKLIKCIQPQILILKHALIGGFHAADAWKKLIERIGGSWVITSALESNIGLNAVAQYTALGWSKYVQGLGTGQLFTNNIPSPYTTDAAGLHYQINGKWDFSNLL